MENASKALIIAGAILIAILLISVGLMVLNSTKGVTEIGAEAGETTAAGVFNSQFTKYCGERVRGSTVRDLKSYYDSYNSRKEASDPNVQLTGVASITDVDVSAYYKVEVTAYDNGYISSISVTKITT